MAGALTLAPGAWWGWLEVPPRQAGWGASPVLLTGIQPLGNGRGDLRLDFIQALHPVAAARRSVVLRVTHRGPTHLAGTLRAADGMVRSAVIAVADYGWLAAFCPAFWKRRPPTMPSLLIDGKPLPGPSPQAHLVAVLGRDEETALRGAHAGHLGGHVHPMPDRTSTFRLDVTFGPFESWLIARGFRPTEMEEKWFIHLDGDRLLFRRSWTGNLIYDVAARWQGDRLTLGEVTVNRDPEQYKQNDDAQDRRILVFLIRAILLAEPASFPTEQGMPAEDAAIQAWSIAGKAMF
ncbi:hypothetical protein GWK16_00275 [Roseomonas sp. JC162]|uniref:Uncharacterized protein n=1 Tax=Neoroseomonas marina TaxID=1232220 RepID=A0A848E7T1_9PROT|nr:hypothetical protein [Neoroseomonas marina]NMJ39657.1 hypothetical protein [Neoroseomonas marina]